MRPGRIALLFSIVSAALVGTSPLAAQTKPKILTTGIERPASAIFIGNSFFYYNNSLHNHLTRLLRSAGGGHPFRTTSVTISGSGSNWHDVGSYFRPNAIGTYSFDADNNIVFNKVDRLFDLAIMMDCSQCPIHPQLKSVFFEYSKKHSDTVRQQGAAPVFFMSWAYADKPAMTAELAEAYTRAGNSGARSISQKPIPRERPRARSLRRRQAAPQHGRDLSGGRDALCLTVQEIAGRPEIHGWSRRRIGEPVADRRLGNGTGLFRHRDLLEMK